MPDRFANVALRDPPRAERILDALHEHVGADRFSQLLPPLNRLLSRTADADMAINNLERLIAQPSAKEQLPNLLENNARGLESVLQLLSTSQFFADTLEHYPEALAGVQLPPKRNPSTDELTAELREKIDAATDDAGVLRAFRKFRHLQMLRIGINDVIRERPLEETTRELARLADASVKVALHTALKTAGKKFGMPTTTAGQPARLTAFAFGKLGGDELNYSSDIDLLFVYDDDGETSGKRPGAIANAEFYSRTVTELIRLLSYHTDRGFAYRVDLRLRPEGSRGPLAQSLANTRSYYDIRGRTWERQALIKLRPVAGDAALGVEVLAALEPFIYRKYFSFSEINEVKALKRQMEQRAARAGVDDTDVKTGRGGIRDIEFAVQFLQLLNGGDLVAVRRRNTLMALDALELAGCLTAQETYILSDAYRFLRKTEHRLQLLFDWQTHRLPTAPEELRKLALRMGYRTPKSEPAPPSLLPPSPLQAQRRSPLDEIPEPPLAEEPRLIDPLEKFLKDYRDKTRLDRAILDHLLHQTFPDTGDRAEPESDLILDPNPDDATVKAVLGRYRFRDIPKAYQNLSRLAQESVRFLSHRRCRHFLASIAPSLLRAVAETADPDDALNNLERVTSTLGAKAVLYELFSYNPPSLKLFVDLCANSPYLSSILMKNAGMEDELLDSLVLDQRRTDAELRAELQELLRGANDPEPILRSFQDNEFLRIGVRDLLDKAEVKETTAALSDVADTVLNAVFDLVEPEVRAKFGTPASRYALVGMGKLGGREISYHSDLDLMLLYESDGETSGRASTSNFHYFTELAQRAIRRLSEAGPLGRLYEVDMRLRPTGKSGSLVIPLAEFQKYYAGGGAQIWERLALTRGRVLRGEPEFAERVLKQLRQSILEKPYTAEALAEIKAMRDRLEASAGVRNLKRAKGGLVDVEFAVQTLQLRHGREHPEILQSNVWSCLDALKSVGLIEPRPESILREGYSFLRYVEARLRIVVDRPLTEVPESRNDLERVARRVGFSPSQFQAELTRHMIRIREAYRIVMG